jgi:hypothetical protein
VALFRRPIPATGRTLAYDALDPVAAATYGEASLERSPADAAEGIIGHYATHLYLHEVIRVPLSVARQLAQHRGHLYLDKLTTITDAVAAELGKHTGGGLSLNNLRHLSRSVAWSLGRHDGELSLSPSHGISDHHLASLIQHVGPLSLGRLKKLEQRTARILASQQGPRGIAGLSGLYVNDVEHVTPPVAAILATHRAGELSLNGITLLTEETARELVRHPLLTLDGVASVTDRVAGILASHSGGTLSLKGLRHASASGLAKLRQNPGIELPRLLRIDATAPADTTALHHPSRDETIAVIERIAKAGEEALGIA